MRETQVKSGALVLTFALVGWIWFNQPPGPSAPTPAPTPVEQPEDEAEGGNVPAEAAPDGIPAPRPNQGPDEGPRCDEELIAKAVNWYDRLLVSFENPENRPGFELQYSTYCAWLEQSGLCDQSDCEEILAERAMYELFAHPPCKKCRSISE